MIVHAHGQSDPGRVRRHNEDAFAIDSAQRLYAVADGMGGAAAGEVASHLFIEQALRVFRAASGSEGGESLIRSAFYHAHEAIHHFMEQHPETRGMGCTAEILSFENNRYLIGHVGDSRSYLIRDNTIRQLTEDHSYIQEQVRRGNISADDARTHSMRNAINRAVGQRPPLHIDLHSGETHRGDIFLLCSDGLNDMLADHILLEIAADSQRSLAERSQHLIAAANRQGGRDNITVVLCQVA